MILTALVRTKASDSVFLKPAANGPERVLWLPEVGAGGVGLWVGALLLRDLLRQHLPPEVGLEELLQARCEHGQLLRVEVFLGGETRWGGGHRTPASLPQHPEPLDASAPTSDQPAPPPPEGPHRAGGQGSRRPGLLPPEAVGSPHLQDLVHNLLHDLALGLCVTETQK